MLKHAPAHPPVIAATSGRPSGLHPIRLAEGHILGPILGHLGVLGGDDDITTGTRASLGSVNMVIDLQDVTSTSM